MIGHGREVNFPASGEVGTVIVSTPLGLVVRLQRGGEVSIPAHLARQVVTEKGSTA